MKKIMMCVLSICLFLGCSQKENSNKFNDVISIEVIEVEQKGYAVNLNSRPTIEIPRLLFSSEDAIEFNEYIANVAEECKKGLKIVDESVLEIHFLNIEYYLNQDVLSIIIKHDPWKSGIGGYYSVYEVYNFSVSTGKRLTNQEIISHLNLDQEKIQNEIDKISENYRPCSIVKENELIDQCIFTGEESIFDCDDKKSTNIDTNQYFYIENPSTIGLYVFLYGAYHKFENIKIEIEN